MTRGSRSELVAWATSRLLAVKGERIVVAVANPRTAGDTFESICGVLRPEFTRGKGWCEHRQQRRVTAPGGGYIEVVTRPERLRGRAARFYAEHGVSDLMLAVGAPMEGGS